MSSSTENVEGYIALADGTVFPGRVFGARAIACGEAVFTTTMSGYQEVLTDPSYTGQLVTMTAPEIGNVGVNAADAESVDGRPSAAGFIVRARSPIASNARSEQDLHSYLERSGVVAISDVDTRALTRHLRDHGAQNAAMGVASKEELVAAARATPAMEGLDLVQRVTPKARYEFREGSGAWAFGGEPAPGARRRVVALDFGAKKNIFRCLVDAGCDLIVVPASTSAADIRALEPEGVFLSSGPGDPAAVGYAAATVRDLLGSAPIFGICLGHQLLALALGAKTYKLKFGHRGANQPVKDLRTGRVEITTQNHGFCVDMATLPSHVTSTHVHLNDGTSEGLAAPDLHAFSVQYHPEASAGPHDSFYLFERFVEAIDAHRARR